MISGKCKQLINFQYKFQIQKFANWIYENLNEKLEMASVRDE